jgi:hypothetical protein
MDFEFSLNLATLHNAERLVMGGFLQEMMQGGRGVKRRLGVKS